MEEDGFWDVIKKRLASEEEFAYQGILAKETAPEKKARATVNTGLGAAFPEPSLIQPGMSAPTNPLMNQGLIQPGVSEPVNPLVHQGIVSSGMSSMQPGDMWKNSVNDWQFGGETKPDPKEMSGFLSGLQNRLSKVFGEDQSGIDRFIEKAGVPEGESANIKMRSGLFNRDKRLEWA